MPGTKTYKVGNDAYDIPDSEVGDFLYIFDCQD